MKISDMKEDNRPKRGGWAPGNYISGPCIYCKVQFIGDKRAVVCADCAYTDELKAKQIDADRETLGEDADFFENAGYDGDFGDK